MRACDRDAVIPIPHKVHLTDLKKFHRRQQFFLVVSYVNANPALFAVILAGEKGPIELMIPSLATDNLVNAWRFFAFGSGLSVAQNDIFIVCVVLITFKKHALRYGPPVRRFW